MNITTLIVVTALNFSVANPPVQEASNGQQQPSPLDRAIALDGADDFVSVPACEAMRYPGTGGWTLELWVKPVIYPHKNEVAIVGQESVGVDARDPWSLRIHPTHFEFRVDDDHGGVDSLRFDMALGVWQHVTCVYEDTEQQGQGERWIAVYVDGTLIERRRTRIEMGSRMDPVYMGALGNARFCGLIDNVRIWSTSLGHRDIEAAVRGDIEPHDTRLRGFWAFDEPGGAVAIDSSAHRMHAILGRAHDPHDRAAPERVARAHAR